MKTENVKRFTLRLDLDLFEQIKKRAKENKRAIGKEIEYSLLQDLKRSRNED